VIRRPRRTFVGAFQSIDRAIINPWFLGGGFLGALVFTIVAALAQIGRDGLPWIAGALALYLVAVNEARWRSWNLVRAVTSTVAFGLLAWALVLHGQAA
jgi:uncharacterized membrane protein